MNAHDATYRSSSTGGNAALSTSVSVTVSNTAQDRWTVTFPDTFIFGGYDKFWEENPISLLGNVVEASGTNQLSVLSDVDTGRSPAGAANGSIQSQSPGASDSAALFRLHRPQGFEIGVKSKFFDSCTRWNLEVIC